MLPENEPSGALPPYIIAAQPPPMAGEMAPAQRKALYPLSSVDRR